MRANITKRERERKENLDVRGTGIFVECVSRITGSYQYALIPRYMKKLERIRIGYTVTLFTRRESRIGDRYEIKKEKRILIKEVSRLFCKLFFFYSGYDKFEILVDEIRYVSFEIKKKRENQRNIEIFSFIQIATNLKFYLFQIVCKFYDILEKLLTVGGQL